jgi:hypothetical protein
VITPTYISHLATIITTDIIDTIVITMACIGTTTINGTIITIMTTTTNCVNPETATTTITAITITATIINIEATAVTIMAIDAIRRTIYPIAFGDFNRGYRIYDRLQSAVLSDLH